MALKQTHRKLSFIDRASSRPTTGDRSSSHLETSSTRPVTGTSSKNTAAPSLPMISTSQTNGLTASIQERPDTARLPTPTIVVHDHEGARMAPAQLPSKTQSPEQPSVQSVSASKQRPATAGAHSSTSPSFLPLATDIPTGALDDLGSDRMQFSNRGSIILLDGGNKRWSKSSKVGGAQSPLRKGVTNGALSPRSHVVSSNSVTRAAIISDRTAVLRPTQERPDSEVRSSRVMSSDDASLSQKVRAMYEHGTEDPFIESTLLEEDEEIGEGRLSPNLSPGFDKRLHLGKIASGSSVAGLPKLPHETAGGIEYWEDVKGEEVDRYGFIVPRTTFSRDSNVSGIAEAGMGLQRVSTPLLEASNTPRRQSMLRRMASSSGSRNADGTPSRQASRRSLKPQGSVYSHKSNKSFSNSQSSLRSPFTSKERKLLVDAGDMLTLPPGMSDPRGNAPTMTKAMQQKEREREAKWKKMGKLRAGFKNGSGMQFDFDVKDPKLISRAWKGIPDRWRGTAWYSFLAASARNHANSATEDELFAEFHEFQSQNSADDVQIDMDVPRTISRHIMFRRRYRGGQRLLFRVLHALSLYFPEVGYVQGMATLAATLLCYYDEEHTFVMMVRLWQLRGLHRLYESGFEGLMDALTEFEKEWLNGGAVAKKLVRSWLQSCSAAS